MALTLDGTTGVSAVQAGAVESGDLPAEAYQKNNILGTVSQSGGVPTGAIIETGSNSNGRFILFADGTQICVSFPAITSNTPETFTFPKNFNENNPNTNIIINATFSTGDAGEFAEITISRASDSGGPVTNNSYVIFRNGTSSMRGIYIIAIGRWY